MRLRLSLWLFLLYALAAKAQEHRSSSIVCELKLTSSKNIYYLGKNVSFDLTVSNFSNADIYFSNTLIMSLELIGTSKGRLENQIEVAGETIRLKRGEQMNFHSYFNDSYGKPYRKGCYINVIPVDDYRFRINHFGTNSSPPLISNWIEIHVVEPPDDERLIFQEFIDACTVEGKLSVEKLNTSSQKLKTLVKKYQHSIYRPYMIYRLAKALKYGRGSLTERYQSSRQLLLHYPEFELNTGVLLDFEYLSRAINQNSQSFVAFLDTLQVLPMSRSLKQRVEIMKERLLFCADESE